MPQFDPTWFVSQIFWLAIVLGVLYWLMSKHAIPRVQAALEARAERIQGDLDRAREALRVAQADTQAALDSRQASLAEEIAKQTSEAEKRISAAKDEAMSNVRDIAIDAAQAIAERLTHSNVDSSKTTAAVDSAINQRTH
jgi:F-type H+-transporting ATPase subunit b